MKKLLLTLLAAAALAPVATARPLTPSEAYAAFRADGPQRLQGMAPNGMRHVLTIKDKTVPDEARIYVFASQANKPGFVILSADDEYPLLVGYSEKSRFEVDNIPPQLFALLRTRVYDMTRRLGTDESPARAAAGRQAPARSEVRVAPLCSTKWSQEAPYNDLCPVYGGQATATGCVATALAQVLKVSEIPRQSTGYVDYSYSTTEGTRYIKGSIDDTFAWDDMLDIYEPGAYTEQQAVAVATLMRNLGYASGMMYGVDSSGALDSDAATALVDNFGCDKGLVTYYRDWFADDEWRAMMLAELQSGRPLYYSADDGTVGHAFVVDGCDPNDFYHINWGWSGLADGYYLLENLKPTDQGTGGGLGIEGFNYNQKAFFRLRPAQEGSTVEPVIYSNDVFQTEESSYKRSSSSKVVFEGPFISNSVSTIYDFDIVLELTPVDGGETVNVKMYSLNSLEPSYGYQSLYVAGNRVPTGLYDARLKVVASDGQSYPFHFYRQITADYLRFNVTATDIYISGNGVNPGSIQATALELNNDPACTALTLDSDNTVDYTISASDTYTGPLNVMLVAINTSNDRILTVATGSTAVASFNGAGQATLSFTIRPLSETFDWSDSRYEYVLALFDGSGDLVEDSDVEVGVVAPAALDSILVDGQEGAGRLYDLQGRPVDSREAPAGVYLEMPSRRKVVVK